MVVRRMTTKCSASHVLILMVSQQITSSPHSVLTASRFTDPHDPSVGLINGDLVIPGNLLRREVFDPVVDQVRAFSPLTINV
jgi:hypothetical protein